MGILRLLSFLGNRNYITDKNKVNELIDSFLPYATNRPIIRVGPDMDGGYLTPDDFEEISTCFSPGVGMFSGFEKYLADLGIDVYMADASVEKPQIDHKNFHFTRQFIGGHTKGDFITMQDWVDANVSSEEDNMILQMDIEGHEFAALESMSESLLSRFRIILLEFHRLEDMWYPDFHDKMKAIMDKLNKNHVCVHNHINNCCGIFNYRGVQIPRTIELTFISRNRVDVTGYVTDFPHPLDQDNTSMPHIVLPAQWIGSNPSQK